MFSIQHHTHFHLYLLKPSAVSLKNIFSNAKQKTDVILICWDQRWHSDPLCSLV